MISGGLLCAAAIAAMAVAGHIGVRTDNMDAD
jgi:hypothetical protein